MPDTLSENFITRFAPSPSGRLHKGHAYSALLAYRAALKNNGRFILRIEDIDTTRCKTEFMEGIYQDLRWLGLTWEEPVRKQSEHFSDYSEALDKLKALGVVYPCFCTRKDIQAEIAAAERAPHGPDGPLYPGICKKLALAEQTRLRADNQPHAWRLDLSAALKILSHPISWYDQVCGLVPATPEILGDIVLARKDTPTSYHLSVVVDDGLQNITHITRGKDLFHATHIHVVLQKLLGLPTPSYHHHALLTDNEGVRFAKRNKSVTLQDIQGQGIDTATLIRSLGL